MKPVWPHAALFMYEVMIINLITINKIDNNHKNDGKIAHFPPPNPTRQGRSADMSSEWTVNETARESTSGHLMRHDDDHARQGARILNRDAARAPLGRPRTLRISGIPRPAYTSGECTLPSTRPMNLTAVTTARHSQGVWVVLCPSRGLHHP